MLRNIMNKINQINKNKKKKKGFTLIELIIVIAIIAILAAVALPKFLSVRETANVKSDLSNAKNIQTIVATLISEGKVGSGVDFPIATSDTTGQLVLDQLQDSPEVKADTFSGPFHVEIAGSNIKIYAGSVATANLIYPDGAGVYASN